MRTKYSVAAAFGAVILQLSAAEAADRTYMVEISPGGAHYAVVRDLGDQRAIAIYDVDNTATKPMAIGIGDVAVEDFEWGGDDYVMYRVSTQKAVKTTSGLKDIKFGRWISVSRETGKSETLFGNEIGSDYYYFIGGAGSLISSLPQDNQSVLFARSNVEVTNKGPTRFEDTNDKVKFSLQRVNLKNGAARTVEGGTEATVDWVVDEAGAALARIDRSDFSKSLKVFGADDKGRFVEIGEIDGARVERDNPKFFGAASQKMLQITTEGDGEIRLLGFDMSTGGILGDIVPSDLSAIVGISYDPRFARARIVQLANGQVFHLDEPDRKIQASLEKALPGASISIESRSLSGGRVIAHARYADRGDEFYFFDADMKKLELVAAN